MYRASHESRQNEKVHGLAPVTRSRLAASQKSPPIGTRSKQATLCHVLIGKNPRKFPGNHRGCGRRIQEKSAAATGYKPYGAATQQKTARRTRDFIWLAQFSTDPYGFLLIVPTRRLTCRTAPFQNKSICKTYSLKLGGLPWELTKSAVKPMCAR